MKKRFLGFLFALFAAFGLAATVKAGVIDEITRTYEFNAVGQVWTVLKNAYYYRDLTCSGSTEHVSMEFKDYGDGVDGYYEFKYKNSVSSNTTETITCSWTRNADYNYAENGSMVINFNMVPAVTEQEAVITLSGALIEGELDSNSDLKKLFEMHEVISSEVKSGGEFINWSCPPGTGGCTVTGKSTTDKQEEAHAVVKFRRAMDTSIEYTLKLTILVNYHGAARAYPGGYTCNFSSYSSDWEKSSVTVDPMDGDNISFYYSKKNNVTFPSCENSTAGGINRTFKGWTKTSGYEPGYQTTGKCAERDLITAGTPTNVGDGSYNYFSCYDFDGFVFLKITHGSTLSDSSWEKWNGSDTDYIKYSSTDVTLPDLTVPASWGTGERKLSYWECDDEDVRHDVGSKVKPGTTCRAVIDNTAIYMDLNKNVYVGRDLVIAISNDSIDSCTAGGSHVTVKVDDGKCTVTGVSVTEGTPDDVTVHTTKGVTRVYKITVKELNAGEVDFIIDVPVQGLVGHGDGTGDFMTSGNICSSFMVGEGNKFIDTAEGAEVSAYSVRSLCSDGSTFASVCLDPAKTGPVGGVKYEKVEDVKPTAPLGLVLQGAVKRIKENPSLLEAFEDYSSSNSASIELRAGTQIAARVVGIATGRYVRSGSEGYEGNLYEYYDKAAKGINALGKSATIPQIKSVMNSSGIFTKGCTNNETYACYLSSEFIHNYLAGTSSGASAEDMQKVKKELEAGYPKTELNGSNGYKITYKGKIIVPKSLEIKKIETCGANSLGIKCYSAELGDVVSGSDSNSYSFTAVIGTDNAFDVKVPGNMAEKMSVSFKLETNGATVNNAFVIAPTEQVQKQRMLMFDMSENFLYMYLSPIPNICLAELEALKAGNCTDEDHCNINIPLFKASKCCQEIADETAYSYIIEHVCNAQCTTSTISPVCDVANLDTSNPEKDAYKSDLYTIFEGAHKNKSSGKWEWSLSALPDGSGGACVVNVEEVKGKYYTTDSDGMTSVNDVDSYTTRDDAGNVRNLAEYKGNKFCQVTCKEDFELAMPAFGNYIGERAVMAGRFFALDSAKIFMYGSATCYTTFIDYKDYAKIQDLLSSKIVPLYNEYASQDHAYTEMEEVVKPNETLYKSAIGTSSGTICIEYSKTYCTAWSTCPEDEPDCEKTCTGDYDYECKTSKTINYPTSVDYTSYIERYDASDAGPGEYKKFEYDRGYEGNGSLNDSEEAFVDKNHSFSCNTSNTRDTGHWSTEPAAGYITCTYGDKSVTITTNSAGEILVDGVKKTEDQFKKLSMDESYKKDAKDLKDAAEKAANGMNKYSHEMHDNAENMYYCQHFALYTLRIGDATKAAESVMDSGPDEWGTEYVLGKPVMPKTVGMDFNPIGSYNYDENQYMQTLDKDNMLVRDDATNRKYTGDAEFGKTGKSIAYQLTGDQMVDLVDYADDSKFDNKLYNNYLEHHWYKGENDGTNPWVTDSKVAKSYGEEGGEAYEQDGKLKPITRVRVMCAAGGLSSTGATYGGGKNGPYVINPGNFIWVDGTCFEVELHYREVNYIKRSIKNSSFYKNKGNWWNGPNNVRVHGEYLKELASTDKRFETYGIYGYTIASAFENYYAVYGVQFSDVNGWTYFTSQINEFPISLTTARNLYQYTYQFGDVGTFFGEAKLGRLMGTEISVIQENSRTCFYEVYENVCHCCGDPIEFHTSVLEGTKSDRETDKVRDKHKDKYPEKTKVEDVYTSGEGDATLNFFTTVSSLSDLSAVTDTGSERKLANNWGESFFGFGINDDLVTHQGEKAAEAIELRGDSVYSKTPEYSYTLTPQTIQEIRAYNASHDYVYKVKMDGKEGNLVDKGTYSIVPMEDCSSPSSCKWNETGAITAKTTNTVGFSHMGSNFLELDYMMAAASTETQNRIKHGEICDTTSKDIKNYDDLKNCRWVDYIETEAYPPDKETKLDNLCPEKQRYSDFEDKCITANYFRLAFK